MSNLLTPPKDPATTISFTEQVIGVPLSALSHTLQQTGLLQPDEFRVLCISDVHLGHGRVPTAKVISYLDAALSPIYLDKVKVVVISGDLFDRRLPHDGDDAKLIASWMARFLRHCKQYDISVILLEGTPSHDNRQSWWMVFYNQMMSLSVDVRYYADITVAELIPGGPTVLYVPDEVNHDANKTWKQVQDVLRNTGTEQVDLAVMHGMFTFQEPIRSVASHQEERYESIVKHRIIIGHHHKPAAQGKIRVPGSVERLRHNEEHDKGHYLFTYSPTRGVFDEFFVINENAMVFTTWDIQGWSFERVLKHLAKHENLPNGSNLRFKLSRKDETYASLSKIKSLYPQFKFETKTVEADTHEQDTSDLIDRPVMTSIRPDTLKGMLAPKFVDVSPEIRAAIDRALDTC